MSFVLVVQMQLKEGEADRATALAAELAEASRAEPGCEAYVPCRDPESPDKLLFYEQYTNKAAFEEHGASEHFKRLGLGGLFELTESRERTFYETI